MLFRGDYEKTGGEIYSKGTTHIDAPIRFSRRNFQRLSITAQRIKGDLVPQDPLLLQAKKKF